MNIPKEWAGKITDINNENDGMSPAQVCKCKRSNENVYFKSIDMKYRNTTYSVKREAEAMKWLKGRLSVPDLIEYTEYENRECILMTELKGKYIDTFADKPEIYIHHLSNCIKEIQSVDIADCQFDSRIDFRLKELEYLLKNGLADTDTEYLKKSSRFTEPYELYRWLCENKPKEELVFSHGDISANVIVDDTHYRFYDLARAGIADKWLDIAFCVRDMRDMENGEKYEETFFKLLNIEPDYEKIEYFILLDEMF